MYHHVPVPVTLILQQLLYLSDGLPMNHCNSLQQDEYGPRITPTPVTRPKTDLANTACEKTASHHSTDPAARTHNPYTVSPMVITHWKFHSHTHYKIPATP